MSENKIAHKSPPDNSGGLLCYTGVAAAPRSQRNAGDRLGFE